MRTVIFFACLICACEARRVDKLAASGNEHVPQSFAQMGEANVQDGLEASYNPGKALVLALVVLADPATAFSTTSRGAHFQSALASNRRAAAGRSVPRMEDFGFLKGSGIGFEDLWGGNPVISERGIEKAQNKEGLRYKMTRTPEEAEGMQLGPDIGPFKAPRVASIWEALGFTATSNNEARQNEKMKAQANAKKDPEGKRAAYLEKYGYPRLVGTKGIFYADQLSTDKKPMGGFGMGKSGTMWPVPEVVEKGTYGGSAGWGGKAKSKKADTAKPKRPGLFGSKKKEFVPEWEKDPAQEWFPKLFGSKSSE